MSTMEEGIGPTYWIWRELGEHRADIRGLRRDVTMLQKQARSRSGLSNPWVRIAIMAVLVGMSLMDVVTKGELLNALAKAMLRGL
jgi:hypothetical protein